MRTLAIYGAGGFGREVLQLINEINREEKTWKVIGFIDDLYSIKNLLPFPVYPSIEKLNNLEALYIAIGDSGKRKKIHQTIGNDKIKYPALIHPSGNPGDLADFPKGLLIGANSCLTVNIKIGSMVIINLNCTIGHDVVLGDYCSIMPGVNISGNVTCDEGVYVGTNATILPGLSIGSYATIGAGAVVTKDVAPQSIVVGVPARAIE